MRKSMCMFRWPRCRKRGPCAACVFPSHQPNGKARCFYGTPDHSHRPEGHCFTILLCQLRGRISVLLILTAKESCPSRQRAVVSQVDSNPCPTRLPGRTRRRCSSNVLAMADWGSPLWLQTDTRRQQYTVQRARAVCTEASSDLFAGSLSDETTTTHATCMKARLLPHDILRSFGCLRDIFEPGTGFLSICKAAASALHLPSSTMRIIYLSSVAVITYGSAMPLSLRRTILSGSTPRQA